MKINIFRNPFIDTQVGYLMDMMVDARRKETEAYWREVLAKEHEEDLDVEYWVGYNNGYMHGYSDAKKKFMNPCCFCGHDDFSTYVCDSCREEEFWNEDIDDMSTNGDNDAENNN